MTRPLESKIESYFKDQMKAIGALAFKFKSTVNGVPDQIVIFKGNVHFAELKRPDEKPRANQIYVHKQIEKQGVPVYTLNTKEKVDEFIRQVLKEEPQDINQKTTGPVIIQSKNLFKLD